MQLSSLLQRFNEPETLKMAKLGRELRAKGFDITDLSLGEPDFDTPDHIKMAAKKAIDENYSHYTPVAGYLDLRQAICDKLKRDNSMVIASLKSLNEKAINGENLMPVVLEAVENYCTLGEIADELRKVFGEYK